MSSVQAIIKLLPNYLKKRNLLEAVLMMAIQELYNLLTYWSRRKLLIYNLLLAQERLERLENSLGNATPYHAQGQNINKLR